MGCPSQQSAFKSMQWVTDHLCVIKCPPWASYSTTENKLRHRPTPLSFSNFPVLSPPHRDAISILDNEIKRSVAGCFSFWNSNRFLGSCKEPRGTLYAPSRDLWCINLCHIHARCSHLHNPQHHIHYDHSCVGIWYNINFIPWTTLDNCHSRPDGTPHLNSASLKATLDSYNF